MAVTGVEKLRVHIFHCLQTASPHSIDLDVGIPARGWHGEAYRGAYLLGRNSSSSPFLSLRLPTLTRALLSYRYRRLPRGETGGARGRASKAPCSPGRAAPTGEEETQKLHLNPESGRWNPDNTHRQAPYQRGDRLQYLAILRRATDDYEFLTAFGAEMFLEIARFLGPRSRPQTRKSTATRSRESWGRTNIIPHIPALYASAEGGIDNNAYTNVHGRLADVAHRGCAGGHSHGAGGAPLRDDGACRPEEARSAGTRSAANCACHSTMTASSASSRAMTGWRSSTGKAIARNTAISSALTAFWRQKTMPVNRYKASKQADVLMLSLSVHG